MHQKMFGYGVEFIWTGCDLCREAGTSLDGHAYCTPDARDSEFSKTMLIGSTWYGFRTHHDLVKYCRGDKTN